MLEFQIDRKWDSLDFISFFEAIQSIYFSHYTTFLFQHREIDYHDFNRILYEYYDEVIFRRAREGYYFSAKRLRESALTRRKRIHPIIGVESINFASPGKISLTGAAEVLREIRKFFNYYFPNKRDKIETARTFEKWRKERIDTLRSMGLDEPAIRNIMMIEEKALGHLTQLMDGERIRDSKLTDD